MMYQKKISKVNLFVSPASFQQLFYEKCLYLPHSEKKDSGTGKKGGSYYDCVSWGGGRKVELILATTKLSFLLVFFHGYIQDNLSHLELTETFSGFSCCTLSKFIVPDWRI
jgi:hypothetical protein